MPDICEFPGNLIADTFLRSLIIVHVVILNSCMLGDVDRGNRYGQLAIRIIERFDSKQWSGRVGIIVDSFVKGWKFSVSDYVETMKVSFKVSLATGDTEVSQTCKSFSVFWCNHAFADTY